MEGRQREQLQGRGVAGRALATTCRVPTLPGYHSLPAGTPASAGYWSNDGCRAGRQAGTKQADREAGRQEVRRKSPEGRGRRERRRRGPGECPEPPRTSPRSPGRCAASLRRESLLRPPPAAQPLLALPLLPKVPLSLASALAEGGGPSSGAGGPLPTARP